MKPWSTRRLCVRTVRLISVSKSPAARSDVCGGRDVLSSDVLLGRKGRWESEEKQLAGEKGRTQGCRTLRHYDTGAVFVEFPREQIAHVSI